MTYEKALEFLAGLNKFGISLGLVRIQKLLDLMGNPERIFKSVHVTGTNGKGSTTAMLATILKASGIKTGKYTSPHLWHYGERFAINEELISEEELADSIAYTAEFVGKMLADGWEHPTEFEVLTAVAFYYFAKCKVEYAVIEVGLGGLLDSTNVIMPEAAVITNVTLDHTDRCGKTVAEIACQKAGIIKKGIPVITAAKGEALAGIREKVAANKAGLSVYPRDFSVLINEIKNYQQIISLKLPDCGLKNIQLNLLGEHQAENAAIAAMTARVLGQRDGRITQAAISQGLSEVKWPGRFEVVVGKPLIVIDGAHNPDGAEKLRKTLDETFPDKEIVFVLGILRDKNMAEILKNLVRPENTVITVPPSSERAARSQELAGIVSARLVEAAETIEEGIRKAKSFAAKDDVICIAGSLYLVGDARRILQLV